MKTLLELPTEVLASIISKLYLPDLGSLALSRLQLSRCCRERVAEHTLMLSRSAQWKDRSSNKAYKVELDDGLEFLSFVLDNKVGRDPRPLHEVVLGASRFAPSVILTRDHRISHATSSHCTYMSENGDGELEARLSQSNHTRRIMSTELWRRPDF